MNESSEKKFERLRDYWRIIVRRDNGTPVKATIQGRRRITEEFWPGLALDDATVRRFAKTMRDALTVTRGFESEPLVGAAPMYPSCDSCAICHGTGYSLETSETLSGHGCRSLSTTVYCCEPRILPAIHVVDDEIKQFYDDLADAIRWLESDPHS